MWRVAQGRKLVNPTWTNPRTGRMYGADDPKNPIGEYWIALEGADDESAGKAGYGIHGTIDPLSVGKEMSMGCVRMLPKDIELVYFCLVDKYSTVRIDP